MNYKAINKQIIDWSFVEANRVHACYWKDKLGFTDGFVAYLLPKTECFLNIEAYPEINFDLVFEKAQDGEEIFDTKTVMERDRVKMRLLKHPNGDETYVNDKFFKHFKDCTLKQDKKIDPVFIYEYNELQGLILPIRIPEQV